MTEKDYRMIMVGRGRVGMTGLETIFKELAAEGKKPSSTLGNELVELAGNRNYIAPSVRGEYAKALLAEYRRYLGEDLPEEFSELSIKILGPGCPRCEALTSNVMSVLAELQMPGDIEHVREPAQIGQYGVIGTPALVVNGKVMTVGRVPSVEQIKKMLS